MTQMVLTFLPLPMLMSSASLSLLPFLSAPDSCWSRAIILRRMILGERENLRESLGADPPAVVVRLEGEGTTSRSVDSLACMEVCKAAAGLQQRDERRTTMLLIEVLPADFYHYRLWYNVFGTSLLEEKITFSEENIACYVGVGLYVGLYMGVGLHI